MSKYAYIVCACSKYIPEVIALLNSFDYVGNKQDIHFYGYQIPQEIIDQFEKLSYAVIFHKISDEEVRASHGLSEVVCRKRYWYAAEVGVDYDAVCVLDADMVFVRDAWQFFKIAADTGFILGASKEQNKVYDDPHHMYKGKFLIPKGYYNNVDLCNSPFFVDTKIWGAALKRSWNIFIDGFDEMRGDNFKAADMDSMNVTLLEAGSADKTIVMPGIQWLGTNEQNLKPYMRTVTDRGLMKTESGIPIFSYHGHIGHVVWRETQLDNRHRCAQGYLKASGDSLLSSDNIAKGSLNCLYERFKKMLHWKIKIKPFNYRHPETDYRHEYGTLWD